MDDITAWLQQLGLGQYAAAFIANDISLSVLPELTDQDLKDIGVTSLGHRRLLLRAIAERNAAILSWLRTSAHRPGPQVSSKLLTSPASTLRSGGSSP
jgi:hypothetical protein